MDEIIQVQDQFYILATSSRVEEQGRVLKHGDTFAVFNRFGSIQHLGLGEQGLYHEGTRYLSRWELRLRGRRPLVLSSTVRQDNTVLAVDLTNPDISVNGQIELERDQLHLFRTSLLWNGVLYERIHLRNYALHEANVSFDLSFDADYRDIFEVRGAKRPARGQCLDPKIQDKQVQLSYRGLDDRVRSTTIGFSPTPQELTAARCEFQETLPAGAEKSFFITVECKLDEQDGRVISFDQACESAEAEASALTHSDVAIRTSNEQLNAWLARSASDLHLMITQTSQGPYPYAGVPWYSTVFGRDGILTAMEYLWINPELARGVLQYLAAFQAETTEPERDAEPGKILHEVRQGEMAALGEIPFARYYGTVDATPLFVMLCGAYYQRTGDLEFVRSIWPHVEAALGWIDTFGDADGDGFIEYHRQSSHGLTVQGWKDSFDSVFHADGSLAEGAVALCEVQGYVYAARMAAAQLAQLLGEESRSESLRRQAEQLRSQFEDAFWCEELGTYAMALDGKKQPCRIRTSNPGHCLFTGIASPQRAAKVAENLLDETFFSGWGVRTLADTEVRYNPMSYHNGSIWPHDNAILAMGLSRYQLNGHIPQIFAGLFDASLFVDLQRMPELMCGFPRRAGEGPTLYPVACAPQSWAAAAAFSLLQSMLGMVIDAPQRQIRFARATLPECIERVWISNLRVGEATVDLALERFRYNVGVEVLRREGDVEITAMK